MMKNQKMLIDQIYVQRKPKFLFEVAQIKKRYALHDYKPTSGNITSVYSREDGRRPAFWSGKRTARIEEFSNSVHSQKETMSSLRKSASQNHSMRHEQNAQLYEKSEREMNKVLLNIKNENCISNKVCAQEERKILGGRGASSTQKSSAIPCKKSAATICTVPESFLSRAQMTPVLWDRDQYKHKLSDAIKLGNPSMVEADLKKAKSTSTLFDQGGK